MKPNKNLWLLLLFLGMPILGAIGYAVWKAAPGGSPPAARRTVLFYQDSMHPWIKSAQPGKCTLCAMELTPIFEAGAELSLGDNQVALSSNSITVLNVQTEEVKCQPLSRTLRVAGTLAANETRKTIVSAPVACRIESLAVPYAGIDVEKGQTLLTLYSPELVQKRAYLSALGTTYAGPTNHLVASRTKPDPFSSDLLAPQSGTVVERNVFNGQYVTEGEKLLTLVDSSVLWFRFDVYERQLPWLQPGQTLDVTVEGLPGVVLAAVVSFIDPTLDDATRTIKVRADIANPVVSTSGPSQRLLRFGMYAEGRLHAELPKVLAVPRTAILFPGGNAYAFVDLGDGAYERRRVTLGRQGDELWEVLRGLDEGERVVTSGNVLIDAQAQFNQGSPLESTGAHEMRSTEPSGRTSPAPRLSSAANASGADDMTATTHTLHPAHPVAATPAGAAATMAAMNSSPLPGGAGMPAPEPAEKRDSMEPARDRADIKYGRIAARDELWRMRMAAIAEAHAQNTNNMNTQTVFSGFLPPPVDPAGALQSSAHVQSYAETNDARRAANESMRKMWMASLAESGRPTGREASSLTATQRQALATFVAEAAGVSQALAADDLAQYHRQVARLASVLPRLPEEWAASHRWKELVQPLSGLGAEPAKNLPAARKQFLPFSTALVALAKQLRKEDPEWAGLKIYHCPMAPAPGLWMQSKGPLRNPFYGSKMLACGEEVKE